MAWVRAQLCKLQKGCTRWFSLGTPASSTTKTGGHDMGTGRFGHSTSSATLYNDVSAMVLFMLFYVLFITILCINNHIEYKNK